MVRIDWHYPHYGNQGGGPSAAVRTGDWKLIEWFDDQRVELFNLAIDPSEQTDLSAKEAERAAQMKADLHQWQKEVGAKFPTVNPKYDKTKPNGRVAKRR